MSFMTILVLTLKLRRLAGSNGVMNVAFHDRILLIDTRKTKKILPPPSHRMRHISLSDPATSHVISRSFGSHVMSRSFGSHVMSRSFGPHVMSRSFGSHSLTYSRQKKWRVEISSIDVRIHQLDESSPPAPLPPVSPPFGVEAAEPTAPMPTGTLFLSPHLVGNASPIVWFITLRIPT